MYLLSTKHYGVGDDSTPDDSTPGEIEMPDAGVGAANTLTAADFNSTRYPGICKPTNAAALQAVLELQRQMNRVAQSKGFTKIQVDGDVGPGSLALYAKIDGTTPGSCLVLAMAAPALAARYKATADASGVPAMVAQPSPSSTPSYVTATGKSVSVSTPESGIGGAFNGLSTPMKLAVAGAAIAVGLAVFGKKKRRSTTSIRVRR